MCSESGWWEPRVVQEGSLEMHADMDFHRCETTIHTSLEVQEMWFCALLSEHLVFHVG